MLTIQLSYDAAFQALLALGARRDALKAAILAGHTGGGEAETDLAACEAAIEAITVVARQMTAA